jgi:hypothetical protein
MPQTKRRQVKKDWPDIISDEDLLCTHWDDDDDEMCDRVATHQIVLKTTTLNALVVLCSKHKSMHDHKNMQRRVMNRK